MLVTAQRVQSTRTRRTGINAFFFHHGADESALINWHPPDIEEVVTNHPGELVAELIEVIPGGNSVDSFLDVLAPDGTSKEEILGLLGLTSELITSANGGRPVVRGRVTARLRCADSISNQDRPSEARR